MSVVHPTKPPNVVEARESEPKLAVQPEDRRRKVVLAAGGVALGLVALVFLVSRSSPTQDSTHESAASAPIAASPPPAPAPSEAAVPSAVASAQASSDLPAMSLDAATRPASRPAPARRRDVPRSSSSPKGDTAPTSDERIHDVGY
jgi:hypothetical protein